MKNISIVFVSVILFTSFAGEQFKSKIKFKYDEFYNVTSLSLTDLIVKNDKDKVAVIYFLVGNEGDTLVKPKDVLLNFTEWNSDWEYLNCTAMNFLIDTARVSLGETRHDGKAQIGGVIESLSYTQPFIFLEQLAKAKKVRFKVCNSIFKIDEENLNQIKAYHDAIAEKIKKITK